MCELSLDFSRKELWKQNFVFWDFKTRVILSVYHILTKYTKDKNLMLAMHHGNGRVVEIVDVMTSSSFLSYVGACFFLPLVDFPRSLFKRHGLNFVAFCSNESSSKQWNFTFIWVKKKQFEIIFVTKNYICISVQRVPSIFTAVLA